MGLIARISERDTIGEFERAWLARRREANVLHRAKRNYWAVYTAGYVIEMVLKAACFRFLGLSEGESLRPFLNRRVANEQAARYGITRPQNLHDLVFWARLLLAARDSDGKSLPLEVNNALMNHVQRSAQHWRETMRYRDSIRASREYDSVNRCMMWVVLNYATLAR